MFFPRLLRLLALSIVLLPVACQATTMSDLVKSISNVVEGVRERQLVSGKDPFDLIVTYEGDRGVWRHESLTPIIIEQVYDTNYVSISSGWAGSYLPVVQPEPPSGYEVHEDAPDHAWVKKGGQVLWESPSGWMLSYYGWGFSYYSILVAPALNDWRDAYQGSLILDNITNLWSAVGSFWGGSDINILMTTGSFPVVAETYQSSTNLTVSNQVSGVYEYEYSDFFGTHTTNAHIQINMKMLRAIDDAVYDLLDYPYDANPWVICTTNADWNDYLETLGSESNYPEDFPRQSYANIFEQEGIGWTYGIESNEWGDITGGYYRQGISYASNITYVIAHSVKTSEGWEHHNYQDKPEGWEWGWWSFVSEDSPVGGFIRFSSSAYPELVYIPHGTNAIPGDDITFDGMASYLSELTNGVYMPSYETNVYEVVGFGEAFTNQYFALFSNNVPDSVGSTGDTFQVRYTVANPLFAGSLYNYPAYYSVGSLTQKIKEWEIVLSNIVWYSPPKDQFYDYEVAADASVQNGVSTYYYSARPSWLYDPSMWTYGVWSDGDSEIPSYSPSGWASGARYPYLYTYDNTARARNAGNYPLARSYKAATNISELLSVDIEYYVQDNYIYTNNTRTFADSGFDIGRSESNLYSWAKYEHSAEIAAYTNIYYAGPYSTGLSTNTAYGFFCPWLGHDRGNETSYLRPLDSEIQTGVTIIGGFGYEGLSLRMLLKFDCTNGFKHFAGDSP